MDLAQRLVAYKAIEDTRRRPLIVYATSTRAGVPARIAGDAVREFLDQMDAIPAGTKAVDVLIHSTGGDALAAWKLMSVLRERFASVSVLVPYMAFSAATIFALGADEIVMHPHASLGPIDPQITMRTPDGAQRQFAFEDVGAFLRFLKDEIGITEQTHITAIIDKLFSVVDPINVGASKRASELATDVGERLLRMHMRTPKDRVRARHIAEGLNKSFFAHSDAVSRSRARELRLKIAKDNTDLEKLLWSAYLCIETCMELRAPFNGLQYYLANGGAATLTAPQALVVPPNTPPQMVNQLWSQVGAQALQNLSQPALEVPYTLVNALVESPRRASVFTTKGKLSAVRMPGGQIQMASTDYESGWKECLIPGAVPQA